MGKSVKFTKTQRVAIFSSDKPHIGREKYVRPFSI